MSQLTLHNQATYVNVKNRVIIGLDNGGVVVCFIPNHYLNSFQLVISKTQLNNELDKFF